jgi:hypothetical protein
VAVILDTNAISALLSVIPLSVWFWRGMSAIT